MNYKKNYESIGIVWNFMELVFMSLTSCLLVSYFGGSYSCGNEAEQVC